MAVKWVIDINKAAFSFIADQLFHNIVECNVNSLLNN